MSSSLDHCWYLERVGHKELPHYILQNSKDVIKVGRKVGKNDRVLNSKQISREHFVFIRHGDPEDWESIRWSVKDLGGINGTYINQVKIQSNEPMVLNADELIGIGTFDSKSKSMPDGERSFVYMLKAPTAFYQNQEGENDDMDTDGETPPPSVAGEVDVASSSNVKDVKLQQQHPYQQQQLLSKGPQQPPHKQTLNQKVVTPEAGSSSGGSSTSIKIQEKSKVVLKGEEEELAASKEVQADKPKQKEKKSTKRKERKYSSEEEIAKSGSKKRRVCIIYDSSNDDGDEQQFPAKTRETDWTSDSSEQSNFDLAKIVTGLKRKKSQVSIPLLHLPSRAVGAKLHPRVVMLHNEPDVVYDINKWRRVSADDYKPISRQWRRLATDGSQGTPLLAALDTGSSFTFTSDDECPSHPEPFKQFRSNLSGSGSPDSDKVFGDSDRGPRDSDNGNMASRETSDDESTYQPRKSKDKKRPESRKIKSKVEKEDKRSAKENRTEMHKKMSKNEYRSKKETKVAARKVQDNSSRSSSPGLCGGPVLLRALSGNYEDISSDEEINKELETVGVHNIKKSMEESDFSSKSSSPLVFYDPNEKKPLSPVPRPRSSSVEIVSDTDEIIANANAILARENIVTSVPDITKSDSLNSSFILTKSGSSLYKSAVLGSGSSAGIMESSKDLHLSIASPSVGSSGSVIINPGMVASTPLAAATSTPLAAATSTPLAAATSVLLPGLTTSISTGVFSDEEDTSIYDPPPLTNKSLDLDNSGFGKGPIYQEYKKELEEEDKEEVKEFKEVKVEGDLMIKQEAFNSSYHQYEEVVTIQDSEDEDNYLETTMSQSIVVADSENERSEDNDSDVEFLKECGPEKNEEHDILSGLEDSDDEETLSSSQTRLFDRIKSHNKIEIKTLIKTEPSLSLTEDEQLSQSLLEDAQDAEEEDLVPDILAVLSSSKGGRLVDHQLVLDAFRKDRETPNLDEPGKSSSDNIFRLAREEMETRAVDQTMAAVGCGKGLVRECLAELRGDNQEFFIDQMDLDELERMVRTTSDKNKVIEALSKDAELDMEILRGVITKMEDKKLKIELDAVKDAYQQRVIKNKEQASLKRWKDSVEARQPMSKSTAKEAQKSSSGAGWRSEDLLGDNRMSEDEANLPEILKPSASATEKSDESSAESIDELLGGLDDDDFPEDFNDDDDGGLSAVRPDHQSEEDFEEESDKQSVAPEADNDPYAERQTPAEQQTPAEPQTTPADVQSSLQTLSLDTLKAKHKRPELQRAMSGPILTDALPQPHRRAFNRGISAQTVDNLLSKQDNTTKQDNLASVTSTTNKNEPIEKYRGMFQKRAPEVDRPKSRDEVALERKARLKNLAEKEKRGKETATKSASSALAGKMKSSQPKSRRLLEEMAVAGPIKPVARRTFPKEQERTASGDKSIRSIEKQKEQQKPALVSSRRNTDPETTNFARPSSPLRVRRKSECEGSGSVSESIRSCESEGKGGFLEVEAQTDRKLSKKDKVERTEDGGYQMKKLSASNMDYNVCSQDISKLPKQTKYLNFKGVRPDPGKKKKASNKKKNLSWADKDGLTPLVMVRVIEAENKGRKVNNIKDIMDPKQHGSKLKEVTIDDLIQQMVNWNVAWLKEQRKPGVMEEPPVNGSYVVNSLPSTFNSFQDYRRMFIPLFLHELWSSLSREVAEKEERGNEDKLPVIIQEIKPRERDSRFTTFQCCSLLTESEARKDPGQDGTFVTINLSYNIGDTNGAKEIRQTFGHVREINKTRLGDYVFGENERIQRDLIMAKKKSKDAKYWVKYTIRTKTSLLGAKEKRSICITKPVIVQFLARIKPDLRKAQAMLDLPKSKLFSCIVNPDNKSLAVRASNGALHPNIKDLAQFRQLNDNQRRVVVGVTRSCLEDNESKISLVQGPPGTGKSKTIVGIILQLISARLNSRENVENVRKDKHRVPRILVCAPSNAAVDNLGLKLADVKESLPESKQFTFVRLGVVKSMHPEVQKYSFDTILEKMVNSDIRQIKSSNSLEVDEKNKQQQANRLYDEKIRAENQGSTDLAAKLERDYKEVMKEKDRIRSCLNKPLDRKQRHLIEQNATKRLMCDVDIVLTTLSSSLNQVMDNYFVKENGTSRDKDKFRDISVCIMDEASQCTEPEALIPLKLRFNKLVMVGDHEQLPATVMSQKAKNYGYQQSLFGRLIKLSSGMSGEDCRSPVLRLTTQYRMHNEISLWPSKRFYGGLLTPGDQKRDSVLAPYTLLDIVAKENNDKGSLSNEAECRLAVDVAQALRKLTNNKHLSIGIITFYAKQKANISLEIQNRRIPGVDVNTVDGYQGSERDIIIISSVRSGGSSIGFLESRERLNVALTRSKLALVLIGDLNTLKTSEMWDELIKNARLRNVVVDMAKGPRLEEVLRKKIAS